MKKQTSEYFYDNKRFDKEDSECSKRKRKAMMLGRGGNSLGESSRSLSVPKKQQFNNHLLIIDELWEKYPSQMAKKSIRQKRRLLDSYVQTFNSKIGAVKKEFKEEKNIDDYLMKRSRYLKGNIKKKKVKSGVSKPETQRDGDTAKKQELGDSEDIKVDEELEISLPFDNSENKEGELEEGDDFQQFENGKQGAIVQEEANPDIKEQNEAQEILEKIKSHRKEARVYKRDREQINLIKKLYKELKLENQVPPQIDSNILKAILQKEFKQNAIKASERGEDNQEKEELESKKHLKFMSKMVISRMRENQKLAYCDGKLKMVIPSSKI